MSRTDLFRQRSVVALLAAEVVSTTGSQMTWLALPWFVLVTTESATKTSFVMAAELVGLALLGLPGGRFLGRLGARRTMIVCDAARAPLMLVIPVLHWTGGLSFAVLLAVAFGLGALSAPYFAAQKVIVPELLGEDETKVGEANALFQAATRTTLLLGPALGGVLIGVMGATSVLILDAGSYVISVLLVASFVPRRPPLEQDPERASLPAARPSAPCLVARLCDRRCGLDRVLHHDPGAGDRALRPRPQDRRLAVRLVRRRSRDRECDCVPIPPSPYGGARADLGLHHGSGASTLVPVAAPSCGWERGRYPRVRDRQRSRQPPAAHDLDAARSRVAASDRDDDRDGALGARQSARALHRGAGPRRVRDDSGADRLRGRPDRVDGRGGAGGRA